MRGEYKASRIIFILNGSAEVWVDGTGMQKNLVAGEIYDMSEFINKTITYRAGTNGVSWIAFNPLEYRTNWYGALFKSGSHNFASGKDICFFIPLEGYSAVNGKGIKAGTYARISREKLNAVIVPDGAACMAVYRIRGEK
jgi:hypothetical protein